MKCTLKQNARSYKETEKLVIMAKSQPQTLYYKLDTSILLFSLYIIGEHAVTHDMPVNRMWPAQGIFFSSL